MLVRFLLWVDFLLELLKFCDLVSFERPLYVQPWKWTKIHNIFVV